ncbi:MAG: PmoA family protein [Planctomycetia bacterium]|nr:PmoA family protein [Planctomycetia bacterium]
MAADKNSDKKLDALFVFDETEDSVILRDLGQPVCRSCFGFIDHKKVPEKDARKKAGCYLHPIYGVHQEVLTDNAPRDHYHHHGAFWTWPHVMIHESDGTIKDYDLWSNKTPIHQFFVKWLEISSSADTAVLAVENGWYINDVELDDHFRVVKGEKIMKETVRITTGPKQKVQGILSRFIDFEFGWTPVSKPISLRGAENKSYGGFSVRFKPHGQKKLDTVITTPVGGSQGDADLLETPLPWADFTSRFAGDLSQSGATIIVPKTHPDYPPTWMTRYYGAMCVGWPGIKDKTFAPGKEFRLAYRLWIHEGPVTQKQIEKVVAN